MTKKANTGAIIIGAGVLGFLAYKAFSKPTASQPLLLNPATPKAAAPQISTSSLLSSFTSLINQFSTATKTPDPSAYTPPLEAAPSLPSSSPASEYPVLSPNAPTLNFTDSAMMPSDYVAGIGTTSETGAVIQKVAPVLAVIPVVGWAAAAVGEIVGLALNIFGNKWHSNPDVRWLVQEYQYYVLGDAGSTSDNKVNEANIEPAVKWFSLVHGVPINTRSTWGALRGNDESKFGDPKYTDSMRVANYYNTPEGKKSGADFNTVLEAVQIAKSLRLTGANYKGNAPAGSWKDRLAAPSVIASPAQADAVNATPAAQSAVTAAANAAPQLSTMNWLVIAGLGGAGLYFLSK